MYSQVENGIMLEPKQVNIIVMDAMGGLSHNSEIKQIPVKLLLNFNGEEEDEISFKITLFNPDNRLVASYSGFLDEYEKDFTPQLPIKDCFGQWILSVVIKGKVELSEEFKLILPKK
ncbi:MAG: hypothetical protein ACFFD1_02245 [Candidatus Thorarchaeota archaeon]